MHIRNIALVLVMGRLCLGAQQSYTVEFEGSPWQPLETQIAMYEYIENGIRFMPLGPSEPGNFFGRIGSGLPLYPSNSGRYLNFSVADTLQFFLTSGSLFGVVSLDLAEYSTVVPDAAAVEFVGYKYDGSIVRQTFMTDGTIDGTGALADFETFHFGPDFNDLIRVEIDPTWGFSLDNLAIVIPEPGTLTLAGLGVLAWAWRRQRRQ